MDGSCLCGAVTFSVTPPTKWCAHCHCSMCRRAHGALFVTWFGVVRDRFRLLGGEAQLKRYASSAEATRGFCTSCGSTMFFESTRWPDEIHVALAAMKDPIDRAPSGHVFFDDRSPYATILDRLPRFGGVTGTEKRVDPIDAAARNADARVRLATVADADDVDRLLRELAALEWGGSSPQMRSNLEVFLGGHHPSWALIAAEPGAKPCGVAIVCAFPSAEDAKLQLFLDDIYVEPSARRRGIGDALMRAVLAIARDLESPSIYLSTRTDNAPAHALFEKHGFRRQSELLYEWAGLE